MSGFMSAAMQSMKVIRQGLQIISQMTPPTSLIKPELFSLQSVRTNVRCYFPRPNEVKRVRRHGWEARMAKATGRRIIMRRLLKGKHVLTH